MTAQTAQTATAAHAASRTRPASPYTLSFGRILRSEWIKLATLRSTWWSLAITAAMTVGIALMIAAAMTVPDMPGMPGAMIAVMPIQFTMLLAGILGVIAVTGEYSTGMIRSTLTAVPARGVVLAAKSVVIGGVLFVASLIIFATALLAIAPIVATGASPIDWSDFEATYAPILLASGAMAIFALIGVGFGFVLRSGAGAIAATVGLLFVLPIVATMFSMAGEAWLWVIDLSYYLPSNAAQIAITGNTDAPISLTAAYVTLGAWALGSLLAAWAVLRTRDA